MKGPLDPRHCSGDLADSPLRDGDFLGPIFVVVVVDDDDDDDVGPRVRLEEKEVGSVDAREKQDYLSKETNKLISPRHLPCYHTIDRLVTHKWKKNYISSAQSDKTR